MQSKVTEAACQIAQERVCLLQNRIHLELQLENFVVWVRTERRIEPLPSLSLPPVIGTARSSGVYIFF